jgi:DNA-binding response OmpR family regulator
MRYKKMADILIIDDELHIRKLYGEFLKREGYKSASASDSSEAFKLMADRNFDLVILDIELNDENGLEVLKKIKTEKSDVPVILNSAYSIYKSDFGSWIADAYVLKSSDMTPLLEKIKELIGVKCATRK